MNYFLAFDQAGQVHLTHIDEDGSFERHTSVWSLVAHIQEFPAAVYCALAVEAALTCEACRLELDNLIGEEAA